MMPPKGDDINMREKAYGNKTVEKYREKHHLESTIFDGFGGTGSVSQYFNQKGFDVTSNDINDYAYKICYSRNNISLKDLTFEGIEMNISTVLEHRLSGSWFWS